MRTQRHSNTQHSSFAMPPSPVAAKGPKAAVAAKPKPEAKPDAPPKVEEAEEKRKAVASDAKVEAVVQFDLE